MRVKTIEATDDQIVDPGDTLPTPLKVDLEPEETDSERQVKVSPTRKRKSRKRNKSDGEGLKKESIHAIAILDNSDLSHSPPMSEEDKTDVSKHRKERPIRLKGTS